MAQLDNSWAQDTLAKLLDSTLKEQRTRRRWGMFFKLLVLGYIFAVTIMWARAGRDTPMQLDGDFTAVIQVQDEIMPGGDASAENLIPLLRKAFAHKNSRAIILNINSPGGSPVQANQIYQEIQRQRVKFPDKKVYAVIDDIGASGAYMVACAADFIYADQASLVGSIGVAVSAFGFVDGMRKLGIERRLYIAGNNKDMLDPFSPSKPHQVAMLQQELNTVHQQFIDLVKASRGQRLTVTDDMFSGRVWVGAEAKTLGLVDGIGDKYIVAADVIGVSELVEYKPKSSFFDEIVSNFSTMRQMIGFYWQ